VNNLHIITLYKLHNKLSCQSRLSRSSCRAGRTSRAHLQCVEPCCPTSSTQSKCMGSTRHTCRVVSRRDVTWRAKWNLGFTGILTVACWLWQWFTPYTLAF